MINQVFYRLAVASAVPFMLVVVAPLSFYFGNINEINFQLYEVVWPTLIIFSGASFIVFLLLSLMAKSQRLHQIAMALLVGIAAATWVQSQLFVWDFGPLDGRGTEWSRWSTHMWMEGAVWVVIILVSIYLFTRKNDNVSKLMVQLVFALGAISVVSSYTTIPAKKTEQDHEHQEDFDVLFGFHPENNTILILLDTYQSDYFDLIKSEYPEDVEFLDGFVFYRNTISHFPTTKPNIPAIMTGKIYKNETPFIDFSNAAYKRFNLQQAYKDLDYIVAGAGALSNEPGIASMQEVLGRYGISGSATWRSFLDYGLFRGLPTVIKGNIYNEGDWLFSFWGRSSYPPAFHGVDIRFLELFEKNSTILDSTDSKGTFKYFHFYIPHDPWRVDERLNYNSKLVGRDGYIRQARGALLLVRRMLEKLKELGIYDNAEIVIVADHGTAVQPIQPVSMARSNDVAMKGIDDRIHSSALALFLHKKPFAKGNLAINESPLMHSDLSCLLGVDDERIDCNEFAAAVSGEQRERIYRFYNWKQDGWQKDYLPPMLEYVISGHSYDINSWRRGAYRYEAGKKVRIQDSNYLVGERILFSENDAPDQFLIGGWSFQEPTHRWTLGAVAGIRFNVQKKVSNDLRLRLLGSPYLARGKINHQQIKVIINNQQVAEWTMRDGGWYEAPIPASLVEEDGLINVVFKISSPTSPAEIVDSTDSRKLGMAVNELVIEPVN